MDIVSKYALYGGLVFWLILVTIIVENTGVYTVSNGIDSAITQGGFTVETMLNFGKTFIQIAFFGIEGFPSVLWLVIFQAPVMVVVFMTLDMLVHITPFT